MSGRRNHLSWVISTVLEVLSDLAKWEKVHPGLSAGTSKQVDPTEPPQRLNTVSN